MRRARVRVVNQRVVHITIEVPDPVPKPLLLQAVSVPHSQLHPLKIQFTYPFFPSPGLHIFDHHFIFCLRIIIMCRLCKKSVELLAMLAITFYSLLTLAYVFFTVLLNLAMLALIHDSWADLGFVAWGLAVAVFLYPLALACLTATQRLERGSRLVLRWMPFFEWIASMRKNRRIILVFAHVIHLQYGMAFRHFYYDARKG